MEDKMVTCQTIADAPILLFNKNHKNFTESDYMINDGTEITGKAKIVAGQRKGMPFNYRLFITDNNKIIYLNKTNYKDMNMTDITLGADGKETKTATTNPIKQETTINLPGKSILSGKTLTGGALGAVAGYAYCKYKKHDNKTTMYYAIGGALIGGVVGYLLENNVITIKKGN